MGGRPTVRGWRWAILATFSLGAFAVLACGVALAVGIAGQRVPRLYFRALEGTLLDSYGDVTAVAHNAGDSLAATGRALNHGARIVEIDVISIGGRLYASHSTPLPLLGSLAFRPPTLAEVWAAAADADAVMLDLKESSPAFLDLVFIFLAERPPAPRVMVVDGNVATLQAFRQRAPEVARILGVSPPGRLAALRDDPALLDLIDGVVMRHPLLDEATAAWLREHDLFTIVYTVNDLTQVNRLVGLGVDAIVTDNLAIMELLGRRNRPETASASGPSAIDFGACAASLRQPRGGGAFG